MRDPVLIVLWLAALRLAAGEVFDPWPEDLDEIAARYLAAWPPVARA
jgi:hypothetical protein